MAGSTFGNLFRVSTFGESHGGAVGVVLDGAPPQVELNERDIQQQLDRRRPGQSAVTTPRREGDTVQILSGVFDGLTTGTPLMMIVYNSDARPGAYEGIRELFRPGHADYTYFHKYGLRDWRGGGRASGRETVGRVAAGAVARKLLEGRGVGVTAFTARAGGVACRVVDYSVIEENSMRACDAQAAEEMEKRVGDAAAAGDSVGGVVECRVSGLPAGLGEPVFDRIEADLAKAMLSIGGVKGFEIGSGFAAADLRGSEHNDQLGPEGFLSNHAGGTLGGITTGQELIFRIAVKPTSSITRPQNTIDQQRNEREISTEGRHDPCLCPRIVPVVEAMACLVLEDHYKRSAGCFL